MRQRCCSVVECNTSVERRMFMCYRHWDLVPRPLQLKVYSVWRDYRQRKSVETARALTSVQGETLRFVNDLIQRSKEAA